MRYIGTAGGGRIRRGRVIAALAAAACAALTGCSATAGHGSTGSDVARQSTGAGSSASSAAAPAPASSSAAPAAVISTSPADASHPIDPTRQVTVSIAHGTLQKVTMLNPQGKHVTGALAPDGSSWHTTEVLGYAKTYRITASGVDEKGAHVTRRSSVTTLSPNATTTPYLQRMGGYALTGGATYGVGIVPVVHFDEPITNEAAAERALQVTTSPHVDGAWYWADNQDVHWRPQNFWPAGTKVTVRANVYGVQVGKGLYGSTDVSTSFVIGARQVTVADDNAPKVDKVRVYRNGKLIRTMNTSMGKHSGETINGNYIDFHTMNGTYTVLEHDNPAIMSSASYGLPANAPGGYAPEPIYFSTKISTDGIYLHELDSTVWYQNNGYDVSHGCLNLSQANAQWYYSHSTIGDPVIVRHTGGPTISVWQGGDWSVPWSTWLKGSALH